MRSNYIQFSTPQFRILSDKQIEELHFATLQILERTGVAFECQEEGEPAIVLNGRTGSHFGSMPDCPDFLDPYTRRRRECHVEDIADMARLIDALPNIEWSYTSSAHPTLPGAITEVSSQKPESTDYWLLQQGRKDLV